MTRHALFLISLPALGTLPLCFSCGNDDAALGGAAAPLALRQLQAKAAKEARLARPCRKA